jgi:hypothetical protein
MRRGRVQSLAHQPEVGTGAGEIENAAGHGCLVGGNAQMKNLI